MSNTIDQRVVQMDFDGQKFGSGVSSTLGWLDKLKGALKLDGASKGLDDINTAAGKANFAPMRAGIDGLLGGFSALQVTAITALSNIVNKAMNAGEQMAKSLTISPIKAGFDEYELKMGSIQTILSNTARYGTQLPEVTANLDALNTYADKTIYNFGDMTKNIGLFTNAGIKIGDATSMIKGFSNEAAASGTSAEGASGAAYQLSQALSAGKVTLMDWRSLQNVGMGNKNMQNGIIDIAKAMGTFKGTGTDATKATKDFNGSLEKGWLKADVMSNYLKIMAGDMDAASMSALGLSKTQIEAFQKQQTMSEDAATKVRTWTQLIGTIKESVGSGWTDTFGILFGDFNEATDLFTSINNVVGTFVGNMATARNSLLQGWKDLGGRTALIEGLKNVFTALFAIIKPIGEAFRQIFPKKTAQDLMAMTNSFKAFSEKLKVGGETADKIKRTFAGVFAIFDIGWQVIKRVATMFMTLFGSMKGGGGGILDITAKIGDFLVQVDEAVANGSAFSNFFKNLTAILQKPIALISKFASYLGGLFKGLDFSGVSGQINGIGDALNPVAGLGDRISAAWSKVVGIFGKVWDAFKPMAAKLGDAFGGLGDIIANAFSNLNFSDVLSTINTGLFAAITLMFKKFLSNFGKGGEDKPGFLDSIKESLQGVTDTLSAMQNALKATTLIMIAAALALLVIAVVALSKIDSAALTRALVAITVMFTQLGVALKVFSTIGTTGQMVKMTLMGAALILIAIAIDILASAVKKLAEMNMGDMLRGMLGLSIMLKLLGKAVDDMSGNDGKMIRTAAGLVILAVAVKLLVGAVKDFGDMNWDELGKGLAGLAGVLASLALFSKIADADKIGVKSGLGVLLIAAAIKVLAWGIKDLAGMNWGEIGRGLAATAGGLTSISIAMKLMPDSAISKAVGILIVAASLKLIGMALKDIGDMDWGSIGRGLGGMAGALLAISIALKIIPEGAIFSAAAIAIVAGSLLIVANVLQQFSDMSWEEIGKAMVMLGGTMLILALAMDAMVGALPGAAALLVVAAALMILQPVLQAFGEMSWSEIAKGLTMLAGAIILLGAGAIILGLLSPLILALGVAVGVLGVGVALAGAGVLAFAVGLTLLAAAGAAGTLALVAMVSALIGLLPQVGAAIGEAIIQFALVIATGGPAILAAMTTVLDAMIEAVRTEVPNIISLIVQMLYDILTALEHAVPMVVEKGSNIIIGFLDGMNQKLPDIIQKGADLIVNFLSGIAQNISRIVTVAVTVIVNFINGISMNLPRIIQAGVNLIISFVNGVADGIRNNSAAMGAAGGNLATAIVEGMVKGIAGGIGSVVTAAKNLAKGALDAAKNFLGIHSPSREFIKIGEYTSEGFAIGLKGNKDKITDAVKTMTDDLNAAMTAATENAQKAQDKINDLSGTATEKYRNMRIAQDELNKAQNMDISSKAKTKAARNDEIAKKTQARAEAIARANEKIHDLQVSIDDTNKSIYEQQDALNQANREYQKSSSALDTLNNQLAGETQRLKDLADAHDENQKALEDETKVYEDAIKTRDDYNKSLRDQYGAQEAISKDTHLSDYLTNLRQQIVDTQQFTIAIQELRKNGLNDELYKQLLSAGPSTMPFLQELLDGGQTAIDDINNLGSTLDVAAGGLGDSASTSLYQSAVDAAAGLVQGLQDQRANIEAEMDHIADYMVSRINSQLGIHSPSRVFAKVGAYSAQGLANGLLTSAPLIGRAAEDVGQTAIDSMKKTISGLGDLIAGDMDMQPVIAPVLDLSNIKNSASDISAMLSAQQVSFDSAYATATVASAGYQANQDAVGQAYSSESSAPITFVQNNNSPKALSQADIYRQTKNQLSVAKGALTSNARKS